MQMYITRTHCSRIAIYQQTYKETSQNPTSPTRVPSPLIPRIRPVPRILRQPPRPPTITHPPHHLLTQPPLKPIRIRNLLHAITLSTRLLRQYVHIIQHPLRRIPMQRVFPACGWRRHAADPGERGVAELAAAVGLHGWYGRTDLVDELDIRAEWTGSL